MRPISSFPECHPTYPRRLRNRRANRLAMCIVLACGAFALAAVALHRAVERGILAGVL